MEIKIALIGNGKTGSHVQNILLKEKGEIIGPFNLEKSLDLEENKEEFARADVGISFVPGQAVPSLVLNLLKDPKTKHVPMVWGSTGIDWNPHTSPWALDLHKTLMENHMTWVYASNFALGMNLVRELLQFLSQKLDEKILPDSLKLKIHEIHHIHKKDAPSGTALSWQKWTDPRLERNIEVTSSRQGDVVGFHELSLETDSEKIILSHSAKNRALFAEGALKAARKLCQIKSTQALGLLSFEQLLSL